MNIASALRRKGLVNWPGVTYTSKTLVESLLAKDAREHHCYFRSVGLHNHLNHQYVLQSMTLILQLNNIHQVRLLPMTSGRLQVFYKKYMMTKRCSNAQSMQRSKTRRSLSPKKIGPSA